MSNKVKNMRSLLLMLFAAISFSVSAQTITVKGNVKDTSGEPIIGASVVEKGNTTNGTITDLDGNFSIKIDGKKTLVISYIGMKTQEIAVQGKKIINVTMTDDSKALDEVVVIGYGTVAKKDLTGSVSSVSAKQLESIPVSSATEALQGKMAGVSISTAEGSPDADVKIRVRGGGSLSQDNSPLYIVDGFPVSSISDIAPTDIESVDVLKDASSTAIYGARGANGVIIITTKSGKEGKTEVNFGASFGFRKVVSEVGVLDPYEFVLYQYELDQSASRYGYYDDLEIYKSIEGNNYQDQLFGRTGNQQQYNLSISGGTKQTKYNISYARNDEKSIMRNSGFSKNNINAKLSSEINKWLSIDFNARLIYQKIDGLSGGADTNSSSKSYSAVSRSVIFAPLNPLTEDTDDENANNARYNPTEVTDATYKQQRRFSQNYNAGVNWKPFKNWTFRSEFGYGWRYNNTDQVWEYKATINSKFGYAGNPQAYLTNENSKNWRNANTITYDNKKLFNGRDRFNVLIGQEATSSQTNKTYTTSVNFSHNATANEILANMAGGTALPTSSSIGIKDNLVSFFGRANYTLMDKYLFTVTMRADGSSKFAKGNRWGYFPSAAFAWRMSDEAFMQNTREWLSNLKFRLSYGASGNNRIPSGSMYQSYSIAGTSDQSIYFDEESAVILQTDNTLANPGLKWETTISRNIGIDFGFWNNRLSGSIDAYWNTTKDLLMKTTIPGNSGYSYQYQNMGQTSNKGIELQLDAVLIDNKDFGLNFNFNISYNRARIDKLNGGNYWVSSKWDGTAVAGTEDFYLEKGGRLGEVYGYQTDGIYTANDFTFDSNGKYALKEGVADCSSLLGGKIYPGSLKLKADENGEFKKVRLGNTVAPIQGGFGLNARFKGFDFSAFFNYSLGNKIINATWLRSSFYSGSSKGWNVNSDFSQSKRYTWIDPSSGESLLNSSTLKALYKAGGEEAILARFGELNAGKTLWNPGSVTSMPLIDQAVENGSFLRINNVTLGYTLPKVWVNKAKIQNVRIYVTGYNLYCFTKYSGVDPEVDCCTSTPMTPGIDYAAYPRSRSFVGGINVTF
ncbi:TonB-dependent receptor [Bacteroides ovatus]|uniref:SusC/RagA family TonB-linked outer membrane protein n=1 Tax=Bacteroides ovatus TaxID=28116 RepID=UPI0032C18EA1